MDAIPPTTKVVGILAHTIMKKELTIELPSIEEQLQRFLELKQDWFEDAIPFNPSHIATAQDFLLKLEVKGIPTPYIYPSPGCMSEEPSDMKTSNVRAEWSINKIDISATFYISKNIVHLSSYNHVTDELLNLKVKLSLKNPIPKIYKLIRAAMFTMTSRDFRQIKEELNGVYHIPNKKTLFYSHDKFHRIDGPAMIILGTNKEINKKHIAVKKWFFNGKLHREKLPAIEEANNYSVINGTLQVKNYYIYKYYRFGKRHRVDGPAYILYHPDGKLAYVEWALNDLPHRTDGPAMIWYDLDGIVLNKEYCLLGWKQRKEDMETPGYVDAFILEHS